MRLDLYLVEAGHYDSRARAQSAIKAGRVYVNGRPAKKPSVTVSDADDIQAQPEHPWVSRGGLKLVHALASFDVDPTGRDCLDIGASTGGFTQVLIENGAKSVTAIDVGQGQLHPKLHNHPKIISRENTDARDLKASDFDALPNLIVCDVSFISAMKALAVPLALAAPWADLITLVKPQFEVGRAGIGKGGIVISEALGLQARADVSAWVRAQGWTVTATDISPIKGGSGNTEYLLHARKQ